MTLLIPFPIPEPDPATPIFGDKTVVTVDAGTSAEVAVPTGTTEGDRLVLWLAKTETATFTGLTGWTQTVAEESVTGAVLYAWEKAASAADAVVSSPPPSYTPAWTGADDAVAMMVNVDQCGASTFKSTDDEASPTMWDGIVLHCDGADESTAFTDSGDHSLTVTAEGGADVTTSVKKFGSGGLALNGSDAFVSVAHHSSQNPGSGDFLFFDGFVYYSSIPGSGAVTFSAKYAQSAFTQGWAIQQNFNFSPGRLVVVMNSGGGGNSWVSTVGFNPFVETFYHLRIIRHDGFIYFYVGGTQLGDAVANTETISNTELVTVGAVINNGGTYEAFFPGVFDEVRVGGPVPTPGAFTPPTEPLAYSQLTCPAVTTGSPNNFVVRAMACSGAPTVTEPAGTTAIASQASPNSLVTLAAAYEAAASAGDVGTAAFTLSAAQPWAAATVALRAGDENPTAPWLNLLSLIFTSTSSQYLSRAWGSGGTSRKVGTFSVSYKRASTGAYMYAFAGGEATGNNEFHISFTDTNNIRVFNSSGDSANLTKISTATFTDTTIWHTLVVAWDMDQADAANRVRVYHDEVEITSWVTDTVPAQGTNLAINGYNTTYTIGRINYAATGYYNGRFDEVIYVDGQQLTPDSFTSANLPKNYEGAFGTKGFELRFEDPTSTTTLGNDTSGNGSNWTLNSMSTSNSSADVPA